MALYDELNIKSISEILANNYVNTAYSLLEKIGVVKERKNELVLIAGSLIGRDK